MNLTQNVLRLWEEIDRRNWGGLCAFFHPDGVIHWPNTNESFTVSEFVRANSEYPGDWRITVERLEQAEETVISVAKVVLDGGEVSFHAVSFFEFDRGSICHLTEYWGDDSPPPQWRQEKQIGHPIQMV